MADEQIVTSIVAKADLSSLVSEVHRASASLQQLQRELLASNRAISSSTKLANNLFRDTLTGSGQYSSHFVNLNSDVDKFGKNLDSGRLKLKNYFQTFREHATTQKGMIRELAKEQVMLQNSVLQPLGRNAQGLMQYNVMIPRGLDAIANSGKLARMEMQIMNRALSEGAGSLINWGKNTQWAGRQLTVGLTVPLTMFGAAAGKAFKEADVELVRLTKVYGGLAATSAAELKRVREEVVETAKTLSKTMGASFKDTIALGADIAATGQMGNELLGSIQETTRLSILGEVDRQDAMKATLSIQTAFKQNTKELTESINFLNAVENQTSTTLGDLVEAIPKAGPVIQQLGGDVKDLALYLTAMREGGINASEGANALKSGLASLINPTKQTVGMMSDFGIDVMGMVARNTGDTTGLLMDLQKALDSLDPLSKARAMEQMFGKFQFARMSALLNNLGKEGSQTLQVLNLMKATTGELADVASRELKMITESASGKYKRAIEGLKAELADVGEEFLGVATKLITAATKILDFFTGLPAPIKKALTFLAGFTALVGPLIMLTGVLANFFGYITKGVVQLRAFFMKANGWKMLTPEIIAAQKAAEMVENAFYSDAAAAQVLHNALQKLVLDYQNLQAASSKNGIPVNPGMSTVGGAPIMAAGRRVVDPTDPYVGDVNTRAMSHINPRDPNNPATIFGGVPGAVPVNRGISRTPQIYMHDRLPNVEGLTSIKGISTGIVPGEAAKHHALMATLGMQSQQEIAALKKTIAMGGTVSRELLDTFDDILPITQRFADSAATQSAAIVQQMRNAEITVEQAKARILALNAQIEADMGAAVSMYAAGRGRTIDLTRAPMMDQPVVDANGQFTLRDLYKKKANLSVMNEFGRLRGVRTFGAPYSIQTTRPPRFNTGGEIESFGPSNTIVSGPSSINYDDRLGNVPLGGYVLNQSASMDPANAALVAMAPSTYLNDGGNITAALTPRETVFGPEIQRMPELYAAVDAANSGYNFGGQIMRGVAGYGKKTANTPGTKMDERLFKKQYKEYLRFINNPRYEDDMRIRMIMLDAAELSYTAKMPMDKAIQTATSNFDSAKMQAGGSDEQFVKLRIKQVQDLEKKYPELRVRNAKTAQSSGSLALNHNLNKVRTAMMRDPQFDGVYDLIKAVSPTTFRNKSNRAPSIQGLHDRGHFRRRGSLGYMTSGYMGVAAVLPSGINNIMSRLETLGLSRDVLNLNAVDARENFALALKKTGMDRFTTVDDLYAAVMDDGKFKSKAQIESGNVVKANRKQRNSWSMFLEAAATRQKWMPGRPPRLVPAGYNLGGMIPGGLISRQRKSYGNPMSLLAPEKMLKILTKAKELSSRGALGSFSSTPVTKYGHQIAASSGMSYPIPGVSGVYRDPTGKLVFVKGVPNELTAIHEPIGTTIMRNAFGINAPVQTARTITNPLDPSKKSKLLALESDFDPRFVSTNVLWKEDQVIRQLAGSLLMNNKDLSRSNVFGNFNPDVGNAGVFAKASGNTAIATEMNSMEKQAMINLLAVRGGARKDFARDTAPIVRKMSPKKYGRLMKKALEDARPELVKIIEGLPKEVQGPYIAMLKRLDDGIDVDWSKYHAVHANPTYLNSGGPVGGAVRQGRYSYGKKGNPAARAAQAKARAARTASYNPSSGSSYTASGNPQMQVARVPYVGGTGVDGNVYAGVPTASMARTVSTMRLAQFPHMSMPTMPMNIPGIGNTAAISAAFKSMGNSIKVDSMQLAKAIKFNAQYIAMSTKENAQSLINATKSMSARVASATKTQALKMQAAASGFYNGVIQQQNAFAAKHYPAGMAPPQGFMGPGYIGRYKDLGDGVQSRKVGSLGFRKTEYLVNNASTGGQSVSMSAAQARAQGLQVPQKQGMGMGMGMGIGMAGSMAGMTLMGKEKVKILGTEMSGMSAGMGVMAASSILPFLPLTKFLNTAKAGAIGLGKGLKTIQMGALTLTKIFAGVMRFVKGFGPIGVLITIATAAFSLYKHFNDKSQDATMGLSQTARAAEEAGIKYFNLKEQMQGYLDKQQAIRAAGQAAKSNGIGMPGLPQSVEDIKKAKEEGKELKDLIESINRSSSPEESKRLLSSTKAQYIAGGMSVEEANRKIYGALLNSKKSMEAFDLLGNSAFGKITDKSTAAEYAVGNLINTINKGSGMVDWGKEITAGFEGLINTFEAARAGLVGTKDEMGNVIDEYKAYELVMASSEKMYPGFNDAIGNEVYENLAKTQPILAGISNEADSLKGILAKYALFTDQIGIDLSKIDSGLAIKLAGFTEAVGTGIAQLTKAGDGATTYSTVGSALEKLKRTIGSVSAATQRSAAAAQRSAQEELKLIAKKIKLIDDEKNKKLEALRATQEASNYALELQKLQIEYADAVSRGDMATANRAKLDIDQLTLNRQSELAQKAIEDAANAAKAPLEKKATGIQDASDKKTVALQIAQENAAIASEMASKLTTFQMQYNDLTQRAVQSQFLPDKERKIEEDKIKDSLVALIKEIQVAGTGNTALAKAVQSGFSKYFDDKGKPVAPTVTTPTTGSPSGFDKNGKPIYNTSTTINPNILTQFNKDIAAVTNIAEDITKGTSLDRLRIDLLKALGYKDKTAGISAFSTGVAITPGTLGKKGQKGVAQTTVNQLTGEKEYLQEGYFSASPASFIGGGRNLQPGTILQIGPKGSVIALSMGSLGIKKSGSIRIESVDYNASPPTLIWTVNKAAGGYIAGAGTGTSDSIPAMLSNGEYVVKASSVAKYGVETLNALNAQKLHKGGPAGHRHGRNLPGSLFKWKPYAEDMPDYWSDGSPSGSPYTQRWGALRYGPAKGKDIWGGTEIPGLRFDGKIANRSDYWHQIAEQPSKTQGYSGMGIDKEPPRYAGSGASMSGIGNGVYGAGSWLTFANGGPVGNKNKNGNFFSRFNPANYISGMLSGMFNFGVSQQIHKDLNIQSTMTQQEKDRALLQTAQLLSGYTSAFNLKNSTSPEIFGSEKLGTSADVLGVLPLIAGLTKLSKIVPKPTTFGAVKPQASALPSLENKILGRFKKQSLITGEQIYTKSAMEEFIDKIKPTDIDVPDFKIKKIINTPTGVGAQYAPWNQTILSRLDGMKGGALAHEYAHHLDHTVKHWSIENFSKKFVNPNLYHESEEAIYYAAEAEKLGTGTLAISKRFDMNPHLPYASGLWRGTTEGTAVEKTSGLYDWLLSKGYDSLADKMGDPYANGRIGYYDNFTHMAQEMDKKPQWKSPGLPQGFLNTANLMPDSSYEKLLSYVKILKENGITPQTPKDDPLWMEIKDWAKKNNFANGGLVGYHKGGPVGHRHGRNLPLTQKQLAQKNKNLSYYESKIDDPINNYSEGFGKIFTRSPFGISAPIVALAADLFGVYFQGKSPGFGKNGIGKALNPTSYEPHVSALMKGMLNPYAEIAKGSATIGDWANAGLSFIPGAGLVGGVNKARLAASAYKVVDKASIGLPSAARANLVPNSVLRSHFVALKKEGNLNTPEFAQARYELALSDALKAAKRNKFTALPDLKNTTAAKLIEENKNLPSAMEESIKIDGKDFIFRFQKGDILPTDAPYIDKFLAGLKEGKETSKTFSAGGMHQVEILDPATKKQLSWINYDPVTGYIHYRGTHVGYRGQHLSEALYNKAVSITRIKHSDTLTDMGRPSALRMGGFMADDPYYGASTSLTGFKQYIDALMKLGKSKKPKPSTGEPRSGIGSWLSSHTPSRQPSQPPSQPSSGIGSWANNNDRFNDRNSVIGWQFDRMADLNDELRMSLRPETVEWFGSSYRTSANFPYGHNGYIESGALPELERIIALERAAAKFANNSYLPRITFANGGLAQNFSNSALGNLGIPMFEDGINMVPADMLALLHKNEAVVPANMNPFNPNATAATSSSVYNIKVDLNGTNVTAQDVATAIHREMKLKEMAAGINRTVGGR